MHFEIKPITKENEEALLLPNEPFRNEGRLVPIYDGEKWSYRIDAFSEEEVTVECFPAEDYSLEKLGDKCYSFAAYVEGDCAGFVIAREEWNKWLYIDNLLVLTKYRRMGLASRLLSACMDKAKELNKLGVWLICQDNNLQAMRCYLNNGFSIGGMNLPVYEGTKQAGKADIYLYKRE